MFMLRFSLMIFAIGFREILNHQMKFYFVLKTVRSLSKSSERSFSNHMGFLMENLVLEILRLDLLESGEKEMKTQNILCIVFRQKNIVT